jgi:hypothetical protein
MFAACLDKLAAAQSTRNPTLAITEVAIQNSETVQ